MKILVVESVDPVREYVTEVFHKDGCEVFATNSAEQGLSLALDEAYYAIITNAWSADLSGLEMISKLRKASIDCPILVHTARCRWQDVISAFFAGADDYKSMPSHGHEILGRIRDLHSELVPSDSEEILTAKEQFLNLTGGSNPSLNTFAFDSEIDSIESLREQWYFLEEQRKARRQRRSQLL